MYLNIAMLETFSVRASGLAQILWVGFLAVLSCEHRLF